MKAEWIYEIPKGGWPKFICSYCRRCGQFLAPGDVECFNCGELRDAKVK